MLRDRSEYPCWTIDISACGVAIHGLVQGQIGERVVANVRGLGWIDGIVSRHFDKSFAISLRSPAAKRETLAKKIINLVMHQRFGEPDKRRQERIIADNNQAMTLKTADGREHFGKLIDVSFPGAALSVDAEPPIGSLVTLGRTSARVVRHFDGGIAVAFDDQLSGQSLNEFIHPVPIAS